MQSSTQPVPGRAPRIVKFEAPRGTQDVLPAQQPLWERVIREAEELCATYGYGRIMTPVFEDTELFARTSGRRLGRRPEGDVHVHRPRRPLADAPPGGDRLGRARVRGARSPPRAAAGEDVPGRADVPLCGAAAWEVPRVLAAQRRGDGLRRPCGRRGDHPALRGAAAQARDPRLVARAELDRRPELPPCRTSSS